jgi:hypothetical protein
MYHETYSRVLARKENKMKTLALMVLCSGIACADQGADAFGTGFANALNQMLYGQQQQQQAPYQAQQPRQELQNYPVTGHYDVKDNYGSSEGYTFESYRHCMSYLTNSGQDNGQCVWVGN